MAITVISATSGEAPYLGTWESTMRGYCGADAVSGALGAVSAPNPTLADVEVVAVGAVQVLGVWNVILVMPVNTPQSTIGGLRITSPSGTSRVYSGDCASYFNNVTEIESLSLGGNSGSCWLWVDPLNGASFANGASTVIEIAESFNCDCSILSPYATLLDVRTRILSRLYPNQASNPPAGMATLIDTHLRDAQKEIYRQLQRAALRTERFYSWTMEPGQRYYGIGDNNECCDMRLDPYKITWVGFEDLNQAWYRLDEGIPPEYYTRANINFGWPTRFEIRSCIEIFPAPQAAYTLWIKGDGLLFDPTLDADQFTIDDQAIYLLALGNMKAERGAKDAQLVLTQASNYIKGLVAGSHGTKRFVPKSQTENPLTPPKFLPLGNDQA